MLCWCQLAVADQLAFGTFRSPDNARNWAQKLRVTLDVPMQVSQLRQGEDILYRVLSPELDADAFEALKRRAQAAGISSWRLIGRVSAGGAHGKQAPADETAPVSAGTPERARLPDETRIPRRLTPPNALSSSAPDPIADEHSQLDWEVALQSRAFGQRGALWSGSSRRQRQSRTGLFSRLG